MNITVDGQIYDLDHLSEDAKAQIASVQAADLKLNELRRDTAITMTARNSYMQALKRDLQNVAPLTPDSASTPVSTTSAGALSEAKTKGRSKSASISS